MNTFVQFSFGLLTLGVAILVWMYIIGTGLKVVGFALEQVGTSIIESADKQEPVIDKLASTTLEILNLIPKLDQPHQDNVRKALKVVGADLVELTRIRDKAKNLVDSKSKSAAS
jgi:hypothetical protein